MDSRRRGIWLTVAAIAAFIAVIMIGFVYRIQLPRLMSATEIQANGLYVFKTPRDSGSFRLDAHTGSEFTHRDLEGHWTLIFFGFTHCPDICPTTLQFLADLKDQLNDTEVSDTRVIMVSVDPERDTVEKLANYVPYFNASFIGLTGSVGDIRTFSQQFNARTRYSPAIMTVSSRTRCQYRVGQSPWPLPWIFPGAL